MTSLYFGQLNSLGVPADEKVVRSTTHVVDKDAPAAMQTDMPQMGEVETDPNPLLGMSTRQMASKWTEGEQSLPPQKGLVDANYAHNEIVDRQVSSSGTAAAREANGEWGHGTLSYAVGIEPVGDLTDGGKMGNTYFVRNERIIQEPAGDYMSPANAADSDTNARVSALGKANARKAQQAAVYNAFWNGGSK